MATEFNVEVGKISQLQGASILTLGISSYLGGIIAGIYGRRLFMLCTMSLTIAGTAWGAFCEFMISSMAVGVDEVVTAALSVAVAGLISVVAVFGVVVQRGIARPWLNTSQHKAITRYTARASSKA
jgi:MFS family permease